MNMAASSVPQNHRGVMQSFSKDQMNGGYSTEGCTYNSKTNADMGKTLSFTGKPLDP